MATSRDINRGVAPTSSNDNDVTEACLYVLVPCMACRFQIKRRRHDDVFVAALAPSVVIGNGEDVVFYIHVHIIT
jgi:hypothetical protein